MTGHLSRSLFFTAIATSRCTQATAIKFLSSLRERRARKRRYIAGGYLEGMPIPARSMPTRAGAESLSTGTSTELDTHGREAALRAPTLIREDRTQRGKCSVSSSSIRSHSSQVRVSSFMADIVAKVFSGWRTKILRAADALYARRREGPYRFIQNRSGTSVVALKKRRSRREVQRSTFARFLGLFDFRPLQQYRHL